MKYCDDCDGRGKIFKGLIPVFNTKTMDFDTKDDFERCSTCDGEGCVDEEEEYGE